MANDSNFDRNRVRGCNYGLEGGVHFDFRGGRVIDTNFMENQTKQIAVCVELGNRLVYSSIILLIESLFMLCEYRYITSS